MSKIFSFSLVLSILLFTACTEDDILGAEKPQSDSINKIMPLGASRVEGARPDFESYRYELWKSLLEGGWTFDYIGSRSDESNYPDYANRSFDTDHEGRGGWTSGQILEGLPNWLDKAGIPDIVLFSSPGGNDALTGSSYPQAIANINAIIDILQEANPNIIILIEQLAPARSDQMTPSLTTFFNDIQEEVKKIASQQSNDSSIVITVDMLTGFNDSYLADDVHYNEAGARFIASRYYDVLINILQK